MSTNDRVLFNLRVEYYNNRKICVRGSLAFLLAKSYFAAGWTDIRRTVLVPTYNVEGCCACRRQGPRSQREELEILHEVS
jgi:hypothetical protein